MSEVKVTFERNSDSIYLCGSQLYGRARARIVLSGLYNDIESRNQILSQVWTPISRFIDYFSSKPYSLVLKSESSDSDSYITTFATTHDNVLRIIVSEDLSLPIEEYYIYLTAKTIVPLPVQECNESTRSLELLPIIDYPDPDPEIIGNLTGLWLNRRPLNELGFSIEVINVGVNQPKSGYEPEINLSTGLPDFLIINGLQVPFIPFDQVGRMLREGKIHNYSIDLDFQRYAQSGNTIIIVFLTNGQTYLVNTRYDPNTKMIYPPV